MGLEHLLEAHKIWLDLLTSIGTVGAVVVAVYLAWKAQDELRKERLSGLAIVDVHDDGTAFLANNTRVDMRFSLYKYDRLLDPRTEPSSYPPRLRTSDLQQLNWVLVKEGITLSPEERLPIHLVDLDRADTFVSLVALKLVTSERTRYWVYRYAGFKAMDCTIRGDTHPHLKWVLEFGADAYHRD